MKLEKKTVSQLKTKCWELCSEYNRRKDADWRGYAKCCTCPTIKQWKEGDAGHFLGGRTNGILFDDRGIHFQCKPCNGFRGGEQAIYKDFMLERYGQEVIDELYAQRKAEKQFSKQELIEKILWYQETLKSMPN